MRRTGTHCGHTLTHTGTSDLNMHRLTFINMICMQSDRTGCVMQVEYTLPKTRQHPPVFLFVVDTAMIEEVLFLLAY